MAIKLHLGYLDGVNHPLWYVEKNRSTERNLERPRTDDARLLEPGILLHTITDKGKYPPILACTYKLFALALRKSAKPDIQTG